MLVRITIAALLLAAGLAAQDAPPAPVEGQPCTVVNAIADQKAGYACSNAVYVKLIYPIAPTYVLTVAFSQPTSPAVAYVTLPASCSPVAWGLLTGVDGAATADILSGPDGPSLVRPTTVQAKLTRKRRRLH